MEFSKYQKIPGPFKRATEGPNRNKVIVGDFTSEELEYLAELNWIWTEKVDGTNVRIFWDGHKVFYGGRTDNAQLSVRLITSLDTLFTEELFEQTFGETEVTLYGEGYGAGIQKGGNYRSDVSFVLFDINIGQYYLLRSDVEEIAGAMGLEVVPIVVTTTIWDAVDIVKKGLPSRWNAEVPAEGLVGTTPMNLGDRHGRRLIVKVKAADYAA